MVILYHGTTDDAAAALLARGWTPNAWATGGNLGQPRYLYLTNGSENALWFADQKGGDVVLAVQVDEDDLLVDPEDGTCDDVASELSWPNGLPGSVVASKPIPPERFTPVPAMSPSP